MLIFFRRCFSRCNVFLASIIMYEKIIFECLILGKTYYNSLYINSNIKYKNKNPNFTIVQFYLVYIYIYNVKKREGSNNHAGTSGQPSNLHSHVMVN